jgi:hypothetical protein
LKKRPATPPTRGHQNANSFPRSAWECPLRRSASVFGPRSGRDGIPTEDRGNEKRCLVDRSAFAHETGKPSWGDGVNRRHPYGRGRCRLDSGIGHGTGPNPTCTPKCGRVSKVILRKEVIQPQVPLRLPCYDLVPITGFTFGACLAAPATSDAPRFGGLTGGVYKAQEHIHRGMLIRDY